MYVPAQKDRLDGRLCVVVGAGASGRASARLLHALGARVRVLEKSAAALDADFKAWAGEAGVELATGGHGREQFADADKVVLSPGVARATLGDLLPDGRDQEVMAELELAGRLAGGRIIAVTGTNGKTTTTSLIGHVLAEAGHTVFVGGNIGTPLSEHVLSGDEAEFLVLEVSSFQAQCLIRFKPDAALLLNFSPNHLDWHRDMDEYLSAKLNLFAQMDQGGLAVISEDMRPVLEDREFTGARRKWYAPGDRFDCPALPGEHNQANMEAAFQAVRRFGVSERDMRSALETFKPWPHRIQTVAEKGGVLFVDDSKSTTVDSLRAALKTFERPVLLLAGGVFKGGDLSSLVPLLRDRVRAVCLFGGSRKTFESAWAGTVSLDWRRELSEAVEMLAAKARPGDVVLLSPGTSSFDQYDNYKARGLDFQAAVEKIKG